MFFSQRKISSRPRTRCRRAAARRRSVHPCAIARAPDTDRARTRPGRFRNAVRCSMGGPHCRRRYGPANVACCRARKSEDEECQDRSSEQRRKPSDRNPKSTSLRSICPPPEQTKIRQSIQGIDRHHRQFDLHQIVEAILRDAAAELSKHPELGSGIAGRYCQCPKSPPLVKKVRPQSARLRPRGRICCSDGTVII